MKKIPICFLFSLLLLLGTTSILSAAEAEKTAAVTVSDPNIPLKALTLNIRHLPSKALFAEADAWQNILEDAAKDVYDVKLQIDEKNNEIASVSAKDNNESTAEDRAAVKNELEGLNEEKTALLDRLAKAREYRKSIVEKLDAILENIDEKTGHDENGKEREEVLKYRRYIHAVSGVSVDISDTKATLISLKNWLTSDDGGIHILINILKFLGILFLAWVAARGASNAMKKALSYSHKSSELLNTFLVGFVRKLFIFIGFLFALTALDINIAPILAAIGAAGFVVAFALQNTLSNFASGIMIMFYKPYDVGDVVDVAGIIGTVESMTMVSTSIMTADNRLMIVPNNTIWGNIITNVTHSDKRRVDLTFGIGYNDDIDKAQKVLLDVLAKHPLILKDPKPTVQVHELADSSVNFICRPWTLTPDYWTVYWEITRRVKIRFDEEGISIPYPQKDIHIISSADASPVTQKKQAFSKEKAKEIDTKKMETEEESES